MTKIIYTLIMLALVGLVLTAQTAYAIPSWSRNSVCNAVGPPQINSTTGMPGNLTDPPKYTLQPNPNNSWRWNSGFAYGYLQIPLCDLNHTKTFFQGYRNGCESIEQNHGYIEGCSSLRATSNTPHYMYGYKDGQKYTNDQTMACILPGHTDDNYLDYYIGLHDGAVAANKANSDHTVYFRGDYPDGHSQEYDMGYEAGWNAQAQELWE